jgi:hypothetical protein
MSENGENIEMLLEWDEWDGLDLGPFHPDDVPGSSFSNAAEDVDAESVTTLYQTETTESFRRWHHCPAVLHRALDILRSRQVPRDIRIFASTPDYNTLAYYYHENLNPENALYVVNRKASDPAFFSHLMPSKPKLSYDWGSTIAKQPRYHLVEGRWITNEKTAPTNTEATLICRGADFKNTIKRMDKRKLPFDRKLKPWR